MIQIEIDNKSQQVVINFGNLDKQFRKSVRRGHTRNGRELSKILEAGIKNPPKTGIKYVSLPNRSSAVGEYPANQSGSLMRSVKYQRTSNGFKVGYTVEYGLYLELGTRNMGARPGLQTTVNQNVYRMKHNYQRELTKDLGR